MLTTFEDHNQAYTYAKEMSVKVLAIDYALHKIHDGMLEEFIAPHDGDTVINILNALRHE